MARKRTPKYVVGIDLGTTNSAVAYANLSSAKRHGSRALKVLDIPQLIAGGEVGSGPLLPSSLYVPMAHEDQRQFRLPWHGDAHPTIAVGRFAQSQGPKVPGRLVTSAKSWLSYGGVDRTAPILPWGSESNEIKISPVEASARFLEHIRDAWNEAYPKAPLHEQDVVLTVPASFDDVARTLTVKAAESVGLRENLVLLEEPQAAFYDYFRAHTKRLGDDAKAQDVLVVDVGGGTTDFTLIRITWTESEDGVIPSVMRLAVGDHILLGGDNMDLALAHLAEQSLTGKSGGLDSARMGALVQSCRQAKEVLLADPDEAPDHFRVTIPGRGTRLVGGAQSHEFSREDVEKIVLDGFVPDVGAHERPGRHRRSALSAWGLPYASDAAITRHVAAFLGRHQLDSEHHAVLLNGGVFKSDSIRQRVVDVLHGWRPAGASMDVWSPKSFDLAVARGAATYGLVRHGIGHRVGGGTARSYYVGIHGGKKARTREGVCLLPRHVEAGEPVLMQNRVFQLVLGRPVRFSLFATTTDRDDELGDLVDLEGEDFVELPSIQTVLETEEDVRELPVTLRAELSEIGILEVAAQSVDRDRRYRLEFSLRDPQPDDDETPVETPAARLPQDTLDRLEEVFRRTYGKPRKDVDPREIKWVRKSLEHTLGHPRDEWSAGICRSVWDLLKVGARRRRRSERHESTFFHLTGFCLRPGVGDPFDEWRIGELWSLGEGGVHFLKDTETWNAWWIMWRRLAAGLNADQQAALMDQVEPWLKPDESMRNRKKPKFLGPDEALRMVGAFERISAERKCVWGDWFLNRIGQDDRSGGAAWCLARIGARQPLYGSSHQVVSTEVASVWLDRILSCDWSRTKNAALAAASIARLTGDRSRDLHSELRGRVAARLVKNPSTAHMAQWVSEIVELSTAESSQVMGDSLPEGLKLVRV